MPKRTVSVSLNQVFNLTTSDSLVIHRQRINQIRLVGNVLSIDEKTTKVTYQITDYTSQAMKVVLWKSNSGGEESRIANFPVIMEQTYVQVHGQARKDPEGNVYVVAFNVQPLSNLNDLTIHLLEVVHHAKELKRIKVNHVCNTQSGGNGISSNGNQMVASNSGFNEIQHLVINLIRKDNSDSGISLDEICSSLRSVKLDTIKSTLDFLLNEGHIYEALDEVHFKTTH